MTNKIKQGQAIFLKLNREGNPNINKWLNEQGNLMDALRFLIEVKIEIDGIQNISNNQINNQNGLSSGNLSILNLKLNEEQKIVDWLNVQEDISKSIERLIVDEIDNNGINNLSLEIPTNRTTELVKGYIDGTLEKKKLNLI